MSPKRWSGLRALRSRRHSFAQWSALLDYAWSSHVGIVAAFVAKGSFGAGAD
jgi:hypothetical protein